MVDPFTCPYGHHAIELGAKRFRCSTCNQYHERDDDYPRSELVDTRVEDPPKQSGRVLTEP